MIWMVGYIYISWHKVNTLLNKSQKLKFNVIDSENSSLENWISTLIPIQSIEVFKIYYGDCEQIMTIK